MPKVILACFLYGVLFGSSSCLVSCGPLLASYILGTEKNILKSLLTYALFSLGRVCVYLALSLVVFFLGRFSLERILGAYTGYVFLLGGGFIFLVGMLICLGKMRDSGLCRLLSKNILQYDKKSIFALGIIIGLSPCAPLLAIFSYLALVAKTWFLALLYSLFFGLGTFFSALLFFPLLAATTQQFLFLKKPILAKILSFGSGLILIFLGISMLTKFF